MSAYDPPPFREYVQPEPARRNYQPIIDFCVCMTTRLKPGKPDHDRPGPEQRKT